MKTKILLVSVDEQLLRWISPQALNVSRLTIARLKLVELSFQQTNFYLILSYECNLMHDGFQEVLLLKIKR